MFFHENNIKACRKTVQDMTEGKQEGGEREGSSEKKKRSNCFRLTGSDDNYTDHHVFD